MELLKEWEVERLRGDKTENYSSSCQLEKHNFEVDGK